MENAPRFETPPDGDLWVFGYGSLIWRPGFDHAERRLARLDGWRRSFCLRSIRYRGTPEAPGLVLGLDEAPGGSCDGVAYRVPVDGRDAVLAYLRERELITYAYREIWAPLTLEGGGGAVAVTYAVDRAHEQYAGEMTEQAQAEVIAAAVGPMGPNAEYLANTVAHLGALGISDPDLDRLHAMVSRLNPV